MDRHEVFLEEEIEGSLSTLLRDFATGKGTDDMKRLAWLAANKLDRTRASARHWKQEASSGKLRMFIVIIAINVAWVLFTALR